MNYHFRSYSESTQGSAVGLAPSVRMDYSQQPFENANLTDAREDGSSSTGIIRIHSDSQQSLDRLFNPQITETSVPLRQRNLPSSFFNPSSQPRTTKGAPSASNNNLHCRSTSYGNRPRQVSAHARTHSVLAPMTSLISMSSGSSARTSSLASEPPTNGCSMNSLSQSETQGSNDNLNRPNRIQHQIQMQRQQQQQQQPQQGGQVHYRNYSSPALAPTETQHQNSLSQYHQPSPDHQAAAVVPMSVTHTNAPNINNNTNYPVYNSPDFMDSSEHLDIHEHTYIACSPTMDSEVGGGQASQLGPCERQTQYSCSIQAQNEHPLYPIRVQDQPCYQSSAQNGANLQQQHHHHQQQQHHYNQTPSAHLHQTMQTNHCPSQQQLSLCQGQSQLVYNGHPNERHPSSDQSKLLGGSGGAILGGQQKFHISHSQAYVFQENHLTRGNGHHLGPSRVNGSENNSHLCLHTRTTHNRSSSFDGHQTGAVINHSRSQSSVLLDSSMSNLGINGRAGSSNESDAASPSCSSSSAAFGLARQPEYMGQQMMRAHQANPMGANEHHHHHQQHQARLPQPQTNGTYNQIPFSPILDQANRIDDWPNSYAKVQKANM